MATKTNTRKARKPMTDAEREAAKAARAAKVAQIEGAAEAFELDEVLDSDAAQRAYDALCQHYSEGNAFLILAQAAQLGLKVTGPDDVAGFWGWKDRGRAVRKGEHQCLFIWQPAGSKAQADKETAEDAPAAEGAEGTKVRRFFKVGGLFHLSQTEEIKKKEEEAE